MSTRFRSFGALIALLALSTYFVEQVYASTCVPSAIAMTIADTGEHTENEHPCPSGSESTPAGDAELPDQPRSERPSCPFGALGSGSSCIAVSLPGARPQLGGTPLDQARQFPPVDAAHELLLAAALFHPPRA